MNHTLNASVFLTFTCQLKIFEYPDDSEFEIFRQQYIANFPQNAIEIVKFPKYIQNLFRFEKKRYFFN